MVKPISEKSPIALNDLTRCRSSCISGTGNTAFSMPKPRALCLMQIIRFSSRFTKGRSRTSRSSVKMLALAPIPRASLRTTVIVSPLAPASERSAYFTLRQKITAASRKSNCPALIPVMIVPPPERLSTQSQ
jgi:hypothetical protein